MDSWAAFRHLFAFGALLLFLSRCFYSSSCLGLVSFGWFFGGCLFHSLLGGAFGGFLAAGFGWSFLPLIVFFTAVFLAAAFLAGAQRRFFHRFFCGGFFAAGLAAVFLATVFFAPAALVCADFVPSWPVPFLRQFFLLRFSWFLLLPFRVLDQAERHSNLYDARCVPRKQDSRPVSHRLYGLSKPKVSFFIQIRLVRRQKSL